MKKAILLLILVLCVNFVESATLQGNVYDLELNKITDVLITVDSTPKQTIVSTDGTYSLELNPGDYLLTAKQLIANTTIASTIEEIEIDQEGVFRLDLILFPEFEDAPEDIDLDELDDNSPNYTLIIVVLVILLITTFILLKKKKQNKSLSLESDEADLVLDFIKKNSGRTTQKDIRKALAMSEAKISLIITELEHKNLIEKIKKGRGNIIILKK